MTRGKQVKHGKLILILASSLILGVFWLQQRSIVADFEYEIRVEEARVKLRCLYLVGEKQKQVRLAWYRSHC